MSYESSELLHRRTSMSSGGAWSILITNIGMTEAELERVSLAFEHTERRHAARLA